MASTARTDELKKKFDENPRRYFAPLANEFRKMGELDQAIMICEEFLPQQPGHMSGHIVYGQALFESGKMPEARVVFETALGLDPENLIALRHLGDICRNEGDFEGARRWYDRVLEADPRNEEIQGLLASLDAAPAAESDAKPARTTKEMVMPPAVPALPSLRQAPPPEMTPIDLDMSGMDVGPPETQPESPAPTVSAEKAPSLDESFETISLDAAPPAALAPAAPAAAWENSEPEAPIARAEGLEPAEFEIPQAPMARAEGLEPSEFEAPTISGPRAEGLELTPFDSPRPAPPASSLPDLEPTAVEAPLSGMSADLKTNDGLALRPHGDALDESALITEHSALDTSDAPDSTLAVGEDDADAAPDPAAVEAAATSGLPMMELSPSVIAAEAVLIETGSSLDSADSPTDTDDDATPELAPTAAAPFVTETMAELYVTQGFRDRALSVYQQLSDAAPDDARLRAKVADLQPQRTAVEFGPTVREFFARIAGLRPGDRGAAAVPPSKDDFAAFDVTELVAEPAAPAPAVSAAPAPAASPAASAAPASAAAQTLATAGVAMSSGAERGAAAQGGVAPPGTIDALFGNRSVGKSDDSAAAALAQAFSGSIPVVPASMTGRPARPGSGELSLDSVFRDGPARAPRASQSFSFDQFFSESAVTAPAAAPPVAKTAPVETAEPAQPGEQGEPAERGADDIQQFNSWLQGLKQK
jgi:tetratricopeptide (TPR) repeat protein